MEKKKKKSELKELGLLRYIRRHWGSIYIYGMGIILTLVIIVMAVYIKTGRVPNPFDYNTLTMLVLMLCAMHVLRFFGLVYNDVKRKEDADAIKKKGEPK